MPLDNSHTPKTFVVTGATSGIGLALSLALAPTAERLVVVGRNEARLRDAEREVRRHGAGHLDLVPVLGDLSTLEGVRSLAERLEGLSRIDVLIHNAGVLPTHLKLTVDGFEESFATNHMAPFVLNHLLRPRLLASAPSRIVQVTSGLALSASIDLEGDPVGRRFAPISTYAKTKLWNLLATLDLAGELQGAGVAVNAVHPGVVRTRLGDGAPGVPGMESRRGWLSPEAGAQGPLRLATAPELASTTGRFFDQSDEMPIRLPVDLREAVVRTTSEALRLAQHIPS